jgi:hypothetical protein
MKMNGAKTMLSKKYYEARQLNYSVAGRRTYVKNLGRKARHPSILHIIDLGHFVFVALVEGVSMQHH